MNASPSPAGRGKILFIGGSLNQTTMGHAVAQHLTDDYDCFFTPYYCDGPLMSRLAARGWFDFTVLGGEARRQSLAYLAEHDLPLDEGGRQHEYDLVVTGSDLIIQQNIKDKPIVLIQEGMTDPENLLFHLVRLLRLPRYLASTSTTGLSRAYRYFCVASEGYRTHFARKGIDPARMIVTGIPNFDNLGETPAENFPYRNYVLVATSDARETWKWDNRRTFIRHALEIAAGRRLIFKLHPNENFARAEREIHTMAPEALVFQRGNIHAMIANCDVLVTQYSTVVYIGLALGKEVTSYFDVDELRRLLPLQNGGRSGANIAAVCRAVLQEEAVSGSSSQGKRNPHEYRHDYPGPQRVFSSAE